MSGNIADAILNPELDAAAEAAQANKRRRAIQMRDFRTDEAQVRALAGKSTVLAQVAGFAHKVTEKVSTPPGATEPSISYLLWGEFEAVRVDTGETFKGASIYLPSYFATEVAAMLSANRNEPVGFALEILMEPNPRKGGVNYQYAVSNMIPQQQSSRLTMLKQQLAAAGKLGRLSAPETAPARQIEHAPADAAGADAGEPEGEPLPGGDNGEAQATPARGRRTA
jgi:hypothetical protein